MMEWLFGPRASRFDLIVACTFVWAIFDGGAPVWIALVGLLVASLISSAAIESLRTQDEI